jgi:hypothetical protein
MNIKKHPYYDIEVSSCGRIFCNGKERSTSSRQRYKRITIFLSVGNQKTVSVHRLVAETFIGIIPSGMVVNHKDGDKHNNNYLNLEIVTPKENTRHALINNLTKPKRGEDSHFSVLKDSEVLEIYASIKLFKSNEEIAKEFNTTFKQISQIRSGRKWNHLFRLHFDEPIHGIHMQVPLKTALSIVEELETGVLNFKQIAHKYNQDPSTISKVYHKVIWKGFWKNIDKIKQVYNKDR